MAVIAEKVAFEQAVPVILSALGDYVKGAKSECENGRAMCIRFSHQGGEAFAVLRGEGSELVAVAVAGAGLHFMMPELISMAKRAGYKTMRCHTQRPGLERALKRYGIEQRETVLGLEL